MYRRRYTVDFIIDSSQAEAAARRMIALYAQLEIGATRAAAAMSASFTTASAASVAAINAMTAAINAMNAAAAAFRPPVTPAMMAAMNRYTAATGGLVGQLTRLVTVGMVVREGARAWDAYGQGLQKAREYAQEAAEANFK